MKFQKFFIIILSAFLALTACVDNDDNSEIKAKGVNDFVWKGLNSWYYWKKEVPELADNAFANTQEYNNFINSKSPDELFYSLLYQYQKVDRYSWIVDDLDKLLAEFSGVSKSNGMNLDLIKVDSNNILALVNYVIPGSPADDLGIKRGNVIIGVNGATLSVNNYKKLFSDDFEFTYVEKMAENKKGEVYPFGEAKTVSLHAVILEENPVAFEKVYEVGGKRIGYLVYNGFRSNYNDELNEAFSILKSKGVTDLILDLRYNGGGSVATAVALGQMITGQYTGREYVSTIFNERHKNSNSIDRFSDKVKIFDFVDGQTKEVGEQKINSLNLNKVYILTSSGTASASELTITGLKPYINVVTIGEETYGKFVGSITLVNPLKDERNRKWAMQPIVFSYYNANKDDHPAGGVIPDYEINSTSYYFGMKEFGNISSDPALKKAYELITGKNLRKKVKPMPSLKNYELISSTVLSKPFGTEMYIEADNLMP